MSGGHGGVHDTLIGRYQLLERISEGGMGVVWRCFDLDLEEPVAVKFLREEFRHDEALRASFRREVKLARRVTHPNVARVYEFGRDGDVHFLTMEHVAGESLAATLERDGRLAPTKIGSLVYDLCRGLAAAHTAGVVHGDIKPGNVLVAPDRGAVLTDFGIARVLSDAIGRDEVLGGTLLYMAPEQLLGQAMVPQSDVYAIGVLLFEALTGKVPWPVDDEATLLAHKLAASGSRSFASGLPDGWRELVADCLQRDPGLRPADGRALLERVGAILEVGAAAGATEVAGFPAPPPLATDAGPQWIEVAAFVDDGPPGGGNAWVTKDLITALAQVRGLRVMTAGTGAGAPGSRTLVRGTTRAVADGVVAAVTIVPPNGAPQHAFELRQPGSTLHDLGSELAARVVAALPAVRAGSLPPRRVGLDTVTGSLYVRAREAYLAMRPEAIELYEAALTLAPGHPSLRLGHTLARVQQGVLMFRPTSAAEIESLRRAVDDLIAEQGALAEPHLARATVALLVGDPVVAASATRAALERAPSLVGAQVVLAELLLDIGRLPDAERHLDIALALDASQVIGWTGRARLRAYQGRWDEFHALVDGQLAALHYRSAHLPRLMLWRPDRAAFERLEAVYASNADRLSPPMCELGAGLVAFGLGREDRRAVFARVMRHPGFAQPRQSRFLLQFQCELACSVGALDEARDLLVAAAPGTFADWSWIEHCPLLEPLRGDPQFAALRERVRRHADAVADAIWG